MVFFRHNDDDEIEDLDVSMFNRSESCEERKAKITRANEIASGLVMGTFERDEEVWEMVAKTKEEITTDETVLCDTTCDEVIVTFPSGETIKVLKK